MDTQDALNGTTPKGVASLAHLAVAAMAAIDVMTGGNQSGRYFVAGRSLGDRGESNMIIKGPKHIKPVKNR